MDAALEDLNGSLKLMEDKFIQDRPFIAGDHITLADLVAIVEVVQVWITVLQRFLFENMRMFLKVSEC